MQDVMNASKPSVNINMNMNINIKIIIKIVEHPPNQGGELSNRLGENIDCKEKNSCVLIGFPSGSTVAYD